MVSRSQVYLRQRGRVLPISQDDWAQAIEVASNHGWQPPKVQTSSCLLGQIIEADEARALASVLDTLGQEDRRQHYQRVAEFCRAGAFMVDPQ